jgi:hypothetical protein
MKAEGRGQRAEERIAARSRRLLFVLFFSSPLGILSSARVLATPTQEEVLKSIGDNVGESVDPAKLLATVFGIAAVIILIALVSQRRKRIITPKTLNHPGKLLKEVARSVNLKPAEIRQLKLLADAAELSSPLLLLICPSVLGKALKRGGVKLDRQALNSIARKIGPAMSRENAKT